LKSRDHLWRKDQQAIEDKERKLLMADIKAIARNKKSEHAANLKAGKTRNFHKKKKVNEKILIH
jgi:hypothetical protein